MNNVTIGFGAKLSEDSFRFQGTEYRILFRYDEADHIADHYYKDGFHSDGTRNNRRLTFTEIRKWLRGALFYADSRKANE